MFCLCVVTGASDCTAGRITNTTVPNTATEKPGSDFGSSNSNVTFDITRLAILAEPSKITSASSKLIDWQSTGNHSSSGRAALNQTDGKVNSIPVNTSKFAGRIQSVSFLMNTTAQMKSDYSIPTNSAKEVASITRLLGSTSESGLKFSAASPPYSTTNKAPSPSSTSTVWLRTGTAKILTAGPRISARVSNTSTLENIMAEITPAINGSFTFTNSVKPVTSTAFRNLIFNIAPAQNTTKFYNQSTNTAGDPLISTMFNVLDPAGLQNSSDQLQLISAASIKTKEPILKTAEITQISGYPATSSSRPATIDPKLTTGSNGLDRYITSRSTSYPRTSANTDNETFPKIKTSLQSNYAKISTKEQAISSQNLTKSSAGFFTTTETIITNTAENLVPFITVLPPMKSLDLISNPQVVESSTIPSTFEQETLSETSTTSYLERTVNATVNFSVSTLIAADSYWSPSSISGWQFFEALSDIIKSVGGFGFPCWQAVPFISVPGLIIDTVVGVEYPSDFFVSLNTRLPSDFETSLGYVSCIVDLEEVQYSSNFSLLINFEAFLPVLSKRMLRKVLSKDGPSLCQNGTEWRLTVVGAPNELACSCPANMMCSGKTTCTLTPKSGDSWAVRSMPSTLCADTKILNKTQVNTSLHISESNGNVKSFLIVGLSSGVSIVIFLAIALNIRRKGLPVDKNISLLDSEVGTNEQKDSSIEPQSSEIDPSKFHCCDETADVKDVIFSISDQISETKQHSLVPLPFAILRKMESEDAGSPISDGQFNDSCHSQSGEIKAELVITAESTRNLKSLQMSGWSPYKLESISSLVSQLLAKDTTSFV